MDAKSTILNAAMMGLLLGSVAVHAEGTTSKTTKPASGECHGINSCKGEGACAGKSNSCKGKNSCKGEGWVKMSKKECKKKNGTFQKMAHK